MIRITEAETPGVIEFKIPVISSRILWSVEREKRGAPDVVEEKRSSRTPNPTSILEKQTYKIDGIAMTMTRE